MQDFLHHEQTMGVYWAYVVYINCPRTELLLLPFILLSRHERLASLPCPCISNVSGNGHLGFVRFRGL